MIQQKFLIVLLVLTVFLGVFVRGCTFSDPIDSGTLDSLLRVPGKKMFVATTTHKVYKLPTGFVNTFPNGGVSKVLEETARVYLVDGESGLINIIFETTVPEELKTSFNAHVLGFKGSVVYVQFSGCKGRECYGDLTNYRYYEISLNGKNDHKELTGRPSSFTNSPTMLAMAPGETVESYYRISSGHNEISHRFKDGDEFAKAFMVDKMGVMLRLL